MSTMKTLSLAVLAAAAWVGVSAMCLSEIATVPDNLASIAEQRGAPAAHPAPAPAAPVSVAKVVGAGPEAGARAQPPHGG